MPAQNFARIAAFVFAAVTIAQIARVAIGFDVVIGGNEIPVIASIGIAIGTGLLAILGFTAR